MLMQVGGRRRSEMMFLYEHTTSTIVQKPPLSSYMDQVEELNNHASASIDTTTQPSSPGCMAEYERR
ncbi:MAG: hypothetical protein KatS3mg057_2481 [Herpetosiphonaceae bacterium]|nr:MAG: hypothetical protein KatS3mg057_2481 [Herpetosiphonaceae bacterium]